MESSRDGVEEKKTGRGGSEKMSKQLYESHREHHD